MNRPHADPEELLVARALVYRFLAQAFHEPGEPLIATLANEPELQALVAAAHQLDLAAGTQEVAQSVHDLLQARPPAGWALRDLRVEYTRLFIGPGAMPCPPYESVYDPSRPEAERGTVLGPSARAMEKALAAAGLVIDLDRVDLADHVAIELEWMYYLLSQAVRAPLGPEASEVERANQFLSQHLAPWLPQLAQKIVANARHPFYGRLGHLLAACLRAEVATAPVSPAGDAMRV